MRSGAASLLQSYLNTKPTEQVLGEDEFWALRNISFSVRRGEILGILGPNGAGKSTLLKCIGGKLKADAGMVKLRGELGHLLEMNAGFDPVLTGRENIRLRGLLMGLSGRRLDEYIASVKAFSELEEFFDSPVQFYSSGMKSRLGFAASSEMSPDVLILDEVLAVGDLGFRIKCYQRINELARNAAVLYVSHSLDQIARMCSRAIVLEKGRLIHEGDVQIAINIYQHKNNSIPKEINSRSAFRQDLVSLKLVGDIREVDGHHEINFGDLLGLEVNISKLPTRSRMRVMLKTSTNKLLMDWNTARGNIEWINDHTRVSVELGPAELSPGVYAINFAALSADGRENFCISDPIYFRVIGKIYGACPVQRIGNWSFVD
jgi:lipopolysaccharide transport system ATP-binding protein